MFAVMEKLILKENKFFWIHPNLRLDFYLSAVISLIMLLAGIFFKEYLLVLVAAILLLFQVPTILRLIKTFRSEPRQMVFQTREDSLEIIFEDQTKSLKLKNLDRLFIVFDPQSKKQKQYLFRILCKCGKNEKVLFERIPASIFTKANVSRLKEFLSRLEPAPDLIVLTAEDLF